MLAERLIRRASSEADSPQLTADSKNPEIEVSSAPEELQIKRSRVSGGAQPFEAQGKHAAPL
jgi:hypothetical protein